MKHITKTPSRQSKNALKHVVTLRLSLAEYRRVVSESRKQKRSISQTVRYLLAEQLNG